MATLNGLPVWAKVVATVGFPIVVALYLLGAVTGAVPSALSKEHEAQAAKQEELRKEHQEQDRMRQEQQQLLRLICANTAKSDAVAVECLKVR